MQDPSTNPARRQRLFVYALTAYGAEIWSFTTGLAVASSPAVTNGAVYVASEDDRLFAFDADGGASAQRPTARQLHPNYRLRPTRAASS